MSSSYSPQHHEPTFCPSCGKRKNNFFNNAEENNNFQDMNTDSFKLDYHSIKSLVMLLITLLNKFEFDKEPKKTHHECNCNYKHHPDKDDWWKHFNKHNGKHECGCKKHEHYDWWTDEEKHGNHHDKHECECKMKDKKPEKNYHHFELKPNSLESTEVEEMMAVDSSSYEFEYKPPTKEENSKKHRCKCQDHKPFHEEYESSSSEEMQKQPHEKKQHEMPDKIWLTDILSLLYNHNLLNLDHLFDQLHKGKQPHKKPTCNCHKEKHWGKDDAHKEDHHE